MIKKNIGVVIYTYNRVDDAKINMEIIRGTWAPQESFNNITIVHVFNGDPDLWPEKYLEDDLLIVENRGHFAGCAHQIDVGVKHLMENYPDVTEVVILASDTWILKPQYLVDILKSMDEDRYLMASCGWSLPVQQTKIWKDAAIDFLIIDLEFARECKMFPLDYSGYMQQYGEVFGLLNIPVLVEALLILRFKQALLRHLGDPPPSDNIVNWIVAEHIFVMKDREPVHNYEPKFERIMYYPALGMLGHHDPAPKQIALKEYDSSTFRENTLRFLESTDLSYFNKGLINLSYGKK